MASRRRWALLGVLAATALVIVAACGGGVERRYGYGVAKNCIVVQEYGREGSQQSVRIYLDRGADGEVDLVLDVACRKCFERNEDGLWRTQDFSALTLASYARPGDGASELYANGIPYGLLGDPRSDFPEIQEGQQALPSPFSDVAIMTSGDASGFDWGLAMALLKTSE